MLIGAIAHRNTWVATTRWHGARLAILGCLASRASGRMKLWLTTALADGTISSAIHRSYHSLRARVTFTLAYCYAAGFTGDPTYSVEANRFLLQSPGTDGTPQFDRLTWPLHPNV
jgi:hypothetical protein